MIAPGVLWRSLAVWRAWRRGRPVPLSVTYFVNEACNLRCRGCFFFDHPVEGGGEALPPRELDPAEALALVDQIADLGVPFLELVGGEPFLREDLVALGRRARERGLWCGVTTNGTRLDPGLAAEAREVFRSVFVSVDGFERAHEAVRGPGTYARAIAGLRHLLAAPGDALVGVTTVIGPENVGELAAFGRHVASLGARQWVVRPGLSPAPAPTPEAAGRGLAELAVLRAERPSLFPQDEAFFAGLGAFLRTGRRYGCDVEHRLHVSVSPGGTTSACCMWPVPLGPARDGALARTLAEAGPAQMAPVADCPGCARHDYGATLDLFRLPLPALLARGLRLAAGVHPGTPDREGRAPVPTLAAS